jgi:Mlc titration factor MtfA (ptsG expression regulator)
MRRRRAESVGPAWESTAKLLIRRWAHLTGDARTRVLEQAESLDRTRYWEGLDGLQITPAMRAYVAVPACVLTVEIGLEALRDVTSIILAPTSEVRGTTHATGGALVSEGLACVLGESRLHGPLRLAWDRVAAEAVQPGAISSVVMHEFAHKIDMADGVVDGTPPIGDRAAAAEFERITNDVLDDLRTGSRPMPLRMYAATNRAELFAVATEVFFLQPALLAREEPGLYRVLADFFRQDPAAGL